VRKSTLLFALTALIGFSGVNAQNKSNDTTARYFIIQASIGNLQEIAIGRLAAEQAVSPEVKAFAQRMVTDAGYPDFSVALQPVDFAKVAEACGAEGYTVTRPEELQATLRKAFRSDRPAVVQVEVDPDEVPAAPDKIKI
jgi:TPP-dependent trihydroxycyclohexane-1,2-dione (THcHDO) dehydratase